MRDPSIVFCNAFDIMPTRMPKWQVRDGRNISNPAYCETGAAHSTTRYYAIAKSLFRNETLHRHVLREACCMFLWMGSLRSKAAKPHLAAKLGCVRPVDQSHP